jgi:phosphoribosylpyrophosphate synthetase
MSLFALDGSRDFGERIARHLDVALDDHEERAFEDGEHKARRRRGSARSRLAALQPFCRTAKKN